MELNISWVKLVLEGSPGIKMDEKIARGTIRISLGAENTLEEADAIAAGLRRIITGKMQQ